MKVDFIYRYWPRATIFYVSMTNIQGNSRDVTNEDHSAWNFHWRRKDMEFEQFLQVDLELQYLFNKMFYVWDGNHRLMAWTEFIRDAYHNDLDWHFRVRSIVLQTLDNVTSIFTIMHDINRAIENSHVKTNLVHILHWMQKVGTLLFDKFKDVLSPDELLAAKNATKSVNQNKPWYNIPREKFLEYIHNIRISLITLIKLQPSSGCVHTNSPVLSSKISQRLQMRRRGSTRTNMTRGAELALAFLQQFWLQWRLSASS